jgi:hypothetical protein
MDENVFITDQDRAANVANAAHVNASISPVNESPHTIPPFGAAFGHTVLGPAEPLTEADKQANGAKVLGDMEAGIAAKLLKMSDEFGAEFTRLHTTYIDMPDEIKAHTMYKALGERIANVEALLNTLMHTAASFPPPAEPLVGTPSHVPHGSL